MSSAFSPTLSVPDGRIDEAAHQLRNGELVAFPTETVYGLGADARQTQAVAKIFALKGRPSDHPVIVHLAGSEDVVYWAETGPAMIEALVARFWPGPLTLILTARADVPRALTGGQATVGLRSPAHPIARALLHAFAGERRGCGIAAPSANRFGRVSPTTALHVREEFGEQLTVLDGGQCPVGIESTILDLSRYERLGPVLLRPGSVSLFDIAEVIGALPMQADVAAPRVSGSLDSHYAPRTPVRLVHAHQLVDIPGGVAVWSFSDPDGRTDDAVWRVAPRDAKAYAFALYQTLRELDRLGAKEMWIEAPPHTSDWDAVNDRLMRAAYRPPAK